VLPQSRQADAQRWQVISFACANLWARRRWSGLSRGTATSSSGPRRYPGILIPRTSSSTRTVPPGPFCARLRDAGSQAGYRLSPAPMRPGLCRMLQVNCRESHFPDVG
jgi:hypothetical protein